MPEQKAPESLKRRVDVYLRSTHSRYIVEELENEAYRLLLEELREAERDLEAAKARVASLKQAFVNAKPDNPPKR